MTNARNRVAPAAGTTQAHVEEVALRAFDMTARGAGAKVCDPRHAGEFAVSEEGRLDPAVNVGLESAAGLEGTHQARVAGSNRLVAPGCGFGQADRRAPRERCRGRGTEDRRPKTEDRRPKIVLEAGDCLLESLLLDSSGRSGGVEASLIDALGEQPGEPPAGYGSRRILESAAARFGRKALAGVRFLALPLAAPALAMVAAPSEAAWRRGPFGAGELATGVVIEFAQTWYGGLFGRNIQAARISAFSRSQGARRSAISRSAARRFQIGMERAVGTKCEVSGGEAPAEAGSSRWQ